MNSAKISENSYSKKERQLNIEFLRIAACFMVVMIHVSSQKWFMLQPSSREWRIMNLYDSAVRSAVPLFFMISGKLFLERNEEINLKKLFSKNIIKLVIVYIGWSILYGIDSIGLKNCLNDIPNLINAAIRGQYHLWYLPSLIGVYLLMPILFCVSKYKEGKYLKYACGMFVLFGIIKTTVLIYPFNHIQITQIINKIQYPLAEYSGYCLMGYYISKNNTKRIKNRYLLLPLMIVIAIAVKIGAIDAISKGTPSGILYGNYTLPSFLEALIIFYIFLNLPKFMYKFKRILKLSKYTFGVYLIHPFILDHLESVFGINTLSFNVILSIPIITFIVMMISIIVIMILSKIPIVNKWLI